MRDSVDKIFESYIASVCLEPFTYKGKRFQPKRLRVSPQIFRGMICHKMCGGCCYQLFTLDWLPIETQPNVRLESRSIMVNEIPFTVLTDRQSNNSNKYCANLKHENGTCNIHGVHPFSCDFELIRFMTGEKIKDTRMNHQKFGRGWNMMRVDGERGALCEFINDITLASKNDVIRKLKRLQEWCNYFQVPNKMDTIITWANSDKCSEPLFV